PISFPVHIPREQFRPSKLTPKANRQEAEEFLFNKENAPEAGWGEEEEEEGRAFPKLYHGNGRALG
ncbi:unnamed protein product, partial [Coccothraustes coccothraustes]